jgi:hypothetical protein
MEVPLYNIMNISIRKKEELFKDRDFIFELKLTLKLGVSVYTYLINSDILFI